MRLRLFGPSASASMGFAPLALSSGTSPTACKPRNRVMQDHDAIYVSMQIAYRREQSFWCVLSSKASLDRV